MAKVAGPLKKVKDEGVQRRKGGGEGERGVSPLAVSSF